jgi:TetR/AcrR family fatty acid metabolism transcriptional regulator
MGSREELRQERRAQILEAAIEVFTEKGFGDATMDDIVACAGLSKGALYWYFESKDELINSIVGYVFERELAHAQQKVQGKERSREKLLVTLEMITASFEEMQPIMPILMEYWAMMMRDERIRNAIGGYYRQFYEFLRPIIRQGVERGEFHTQDVDGAVYALVALAEGMGILWAADPTTVDMKQNIYTGIRLLIAGLEAGE